MKKFLPLFIPLLIIGAILLIATSKKKSTDVVRYRLGGKVYMLLVADEQGEWERGLMDKRELDGADGMIFLFPDKEYRTFWNKNTYLNLDLMWLDGDTVVGRGFLPSIEKSEEIVTASSPAKVSKVIELIKR